MDPSPGGSCLMSLRIAHRGSIGDLRPATAIAYRPPGAAADNLLRSTSWAAEKLFKQRGNFASVLFVAEYADGTRQRLERYCNNAPDT